MTGCMCITCNLFFRRRSGIALLKLTEFILYSRSYCHLCDDMLNALRVLETDFSFTVEVLDVDTDPGLIERYDELVPVLVGKKSGNMEQLCHYFFDEKRVKAYLLGA